MKVRDLFSDASKWTKGAFARDTLAKKVSLDSNNACCFCVYGAVRKCYGYSDAANATILRIVKEIAPEAYWPIFQGSREVELIGQWNDHFRRSFDEVKALVDKLDI